jgi:preprotein translocase subunit SecY
MNQAAKLLQNIWKVDALRNKLLFTLLIFACFRAVAVIPIPGIDRATLQSFFSGNAFLSLLNLFSGNTLANFSILALGIGPYINASIILQMLTFVIPSLEKLSEDGEYGRDQINQYTRYLTLPIAIGQGIAILYYLNTQGIVLDQNPLSIATMVATLTAGTFITVWFGELLTQYGLGNGSSLIIFAGILAGLPGRIYSTYQSAGSGNVTSLLVLVAMALAVVYLVVKVNEATRNITVQYARRVRSGLSAGAQLTHLPIKVNQTGVVPIIFAVSLMLVPQFLSNLLIPQSNDILSKIGYFFQNYLNPNAVGYSILYFFLVFIFTFFYISFSFNPDKVADQIKKNGGFIPGIRPGKPTADHLANITHKITFAGATFLGLIAILPNVAQHLTGINSLAVGGTSILIIVSVVLETAKEIDSQLVMNDYDKFLG